MSKRLKVCVYRTEFLDKEELRKWKERSKMLPKNSLQIIHEGEMNGRPILIFTLNPNLLPNILLFKITNPPDKEYLDCPTYTVSSLSINPDGVATFNEVKPPETIPA